MLMQERESAGSLKPLRLMERSVFSDRMVFVRAVHEAKWINGMELSIYDSWFDPVVSVLAGLVTSRNWIYSSCFFLVHKIIASYFIYALTLKF